jgi:recombination protein RecA
MDVSTLSTTEKSKNPELAESRVFTRLIRAVDLQKYRSESVPGSAGYGFNLKTLRGRLVELSSVRPSAGLSCICTLLLDAQKHSTPVAWISVTRESFYPPDLAANGVDLSVLPVVWVPDVRGAIRAADWLSRTGAFGLLVIDLCGNPRVQTSPHVPQASLAKLAPLAHHHGCTLCFLTVKSRAASSLGSMISLFVRVFRSRAASGRLRLELQVVKDKRRAPGWKQVEQIDGPPGLC